MINCVSKKLLKYKHASSKLKDFTEQNRFNTTLDEQHHEELTLSEQIKKVIIVSGQSYYDLIDFRRENKIKVLLSLFRMSLW